MLKGITNFSIKKKLRLNEKIQKISEESNNSVYAIPNKKTFDKQKLRNPEKFWEDQKNFVLQKQQYIDNQRGEIIKKTELESKNHIPEINKNSRNIAENRNYEKENKNEVFDRLHNVKNNKNKQELFSEVDKKEKDFKDKKFDINSNKNKIELNKTNKNNTQIKNSEMKNFLTEPAMNTKNKNKRQKEEIENYCNKLNDEAKKWLLRNEERVRKIYNKEDQDVQCKNTKILNLKKFINSFNKAIKKLLIKNFNDIEREEIENHINLKYDFISENKNVYDDYNLNNSKLNFSEYCALIKNLGFIKYDYETIKYNLENNEDSLLRENEDYSNKKDLKSLNEKLINPNKKSILIKKQIKKESKLVLDSWKILSSND